MWYLPVRGPRGVIVEEGSLCLVAARRHEFVVLVQEFVPVKQDVPGLHRTQIARIISSRVRSGRAQD